MATPKKEKKVVKKPVSSSSAKASKDKKAKVEKVEVKKAKVEKAPAAIAKATPVAQEVKTEKAPVAAQPAKLPKAAPKAPAAKAEKPVAAKVVAPKVVKSKKVSKGTPVSHGVGRRKACVARVWLRRNGEGKITVNNLAIERYFDTALTRQAASSPFAVYPLSSNFNVDVNVIGGGKVGQADAVKLAIARAFLEQDETLRPALRKAGMLTVDSRVKERKKYGQKAARRKFQFVKR